MRVIRHPEVPQELEAAALWYEERQPGLGEDFLGEYQGYQKGGVGVDSHSPHPLCAAAANPLFPSPIASAPPSRR